MTTPRNPDYRPSIDRIRALITSKAPQPKPLHLIPPQAPEATVVDRVTQLLEAASRTLRLTGMACRNRKL